MRVAAVLPSETVLRAIGTPVGAVVTLRSFRLRRRKSSATLAGWRFLTGRRTCELADVRQGACAGAIAHDANLCPLTARIGRRWAYQIPGESNANVHFGAILQAENEKGLRFVRSLTAAHASLAPDYQGKVDWLTT